VDAAETLAQEFDVGVFLSPARYAAFLARLRGLLVANGGLTVASGRVDVTLPPGYALVGHYRIVGEHPTMWLPPDDADTPVVVTERKE
jgi:hypothetical protein